MRYPSILVLGGTGFIGQTIVARLAGANHRLVVPSRRRAEGRELFLLPTVHVLQADIHNETVLDKLVSECDAVINLIGELHSAAPSGEQAYGPDFDKAHVKLPKKLALACKNHSKRLLHFSALGADPSNTGLPSGYLRSKAAGEQAIMQTGFSAWTVLRPSVVFGPDDKFMNTFASLQRIFPVLAMGRLRAQMQPVYVGDVATATANLLDNEQTFGKCYEVVGPEIYTLAELVRMAGHYSGRQSKLIELSDSLGALQAKILQRLPGPTLMSEDNYLSLAKPSIASAPIAPELGIVPTPIASIAPDYLCRAPSPFNEKRTRARR